ncbi:unnamed protein product [Orchesella dallaii]|uniref:EB domain-containing protein n=1 Tax=Orchesella dallaii TaxID=48710 RepID=A0ABP1RDC6_9HEXA
MTPMNRSNCFLLITHIFILNLTVTHRVSCGRRTVFDLSSQSPPLKNNTLGDPCNILDIRSCKQRGTYCINGTCSCDPRIGVADISRKKCLHKRFRIGGSCVEDVQCSAELSSNSICGTNQTCICKEGSIRNKDRTECLMGDRFPGEHCSSSKDCLGYPDKSECIHEKCQCRSGYLPPSKIKTDTSDDRSSGCLPIVNRVGQKCMEKQQCQQGVLGELSDCFGFGHSKKMKECRCTKDAMLFVEGGSYMELKTCYKIVEKVGDPCKIDEQCRNRFGSGALCSTDNRCVCNGTLLNGAKLLDNSCLKIIDLIGGDCEHPWQCQQGTLGQLSTCTISLSSFKSFKEYKIECRCTNGAVGVPLVEGESDICLKKAEVIGDSCKHDQQCKAKLGDMSECSSGGRCVCNNSSTPSIDGANCTSVV